MLSDPEHAAPPTLFELAPAGEDADYLREQLITYIGNKRSLLPAIGDAVKKVADRLGKNKLRTFDGFAGSGVVSRMLKQHSSYLAMNDLEDYARVIAECFLSNASTVPLDVIQSLVAEGNALALNAPVTDGFIRRLYSPKNESQIEPGERVFYTVDNAQRLDTFRTFLDTVPEHLRSLVMGPLLSSASVHVNTAGVFKGFYKNRNTQRGQFGGGGADALQRILSPIHLRVPVLSRFECEYDIYQGDANEVVTKVDDLDLAYFDPPYNQHPYGSNYFMLNLLVSYVEPDDISKVSGIPTAWNRSAYNVRSRAAGQLFKLLEDVDSRFVLVSYNSEGFVPAAEMRAELNRLGKVEELRMDYNTYRGSRNLSARALHVTEHLYLVEKR